MKSNKSKKKDKKLALNKNIKLPNNRKGVIFLVIDLILLFVSLYNGEYITWTITIMLGVLLLLSFVSAFISHNSLTCTQLLSNEFIQKGDSTELVLKCKNTSPLFLIFAYVLYKTPTNNIEDLIGVTSFNILRKQSFSIKIKIHADIKGVYDVGFLEIRTTDYFGFFAFKNQIYTNNKYDNSLHLVVTPNIQKLKDIKINSYYDSFEENLNLQGNNEQNVISDLRIYNYGDPLKRINWKATAKHQELFINNFEKINTANVGIYAGQLYTKDKESQLITEDYACECTASIINLLLQSKISIALMCDGISSIFQINDLSSNKYLFELAQNNVVTDKDSLNQLKDNINYFSNFDYFFAIIEYVSNDFFIYLNQLNNSGTNIYILLIQDNGIAVDSNMINEIRKSGIELSIIPQGSKLHDYIGG